MSKSEAIHELYMTCKDINFNETSELMAHAQSDEEKNFIRTVTDFVFQQKQIAVAGFGLGMIQQLISAGSLMHYFTLDVKLFPAIGQCDNITPL